MKKIVIVVQCDKNDAVFMCACPVAQYVFLLALTAKLCWLGLELLLLSK